MRALRVVTWNVLHRVHAVNWNEAAVARFPDEAVRIAAISRRIAGWLAAGIDAVCLQEASGDQLASVRSSLGDGAFVFAHAYSRLPRLRAGGAVPLADASEHLVVATNAPGARVREAETFAGDRGKGAIAVDLGAGVVLIDTHVSHGDRRVPQLELVGRIARAATGGAIVVGDFNASADVVRSALGPDVAIADLSAERPTREPTAENPAGKTIDHVVAIGATIVSAAVLDGGGLSDHQPVLAELRFDD